MNNLIQNRVARIRSAIINMFATLNLATVGIIACEIEPVRPQDLLNEIGEKELEAYGGDQFRLIWRDALSKVIFMRIYKQKSDFLMSVSRYDLKHKVVDLSGDIRLQEIDYIYIQKVFNGFEKSNPVTTLNENQIHTMKLLDGVTSNFSWKTQAGKGSFEIDNPHYFHSMAPERFRSIYGFEKPNFGVVSEVIDYLFNIAGFQRAP